MRHNKLVTLVLGVLLAGCGEVTGDPTKYEGTWKYDSGMVTGDCMIMSASQDLTGTSMTLAKGTASDLVVTGSPTCEIKFNMSGNKAVAVAGQTCTLMVMNVGSLVVAIESWTLDTADGMAMTTALKGKTQVPVPGVGSISCTVTGNGALTKQP